MKTVFTLAIGIWIGRQIYINYDHQQALGKEEKLKKRLVQFLKENELDTRDTDLKIRQILDAEFITK